MLLFAISDTNAVSVSRGMVLLRRGFNTWSYKNDGDDNNDGM
jgi:hypothetical protein